MWIYQRRTTTHNNAQHSSINELIDKGEFSLNYVKVDDAIRIIKKYGKHAQLNKTDIVDAFKLVPILPSLWQYHGVSWNNKLYFFVRLCFGSKSSPKIFSLLSEAIHFIATNNYNIPDLLYLLDDFLAICTSEEGERTKQKLLEVFKILKIPIHPKKTVGPTVHLTFLGIDLNSVEMLASLPDEIKYNGS